MKRILFLAAATLVVVSTASILSGSAAVSGPPAPTNLEVISATEDTITIAWGPAQPGEFYPISVPKKNTLRIGWGPSQDSRSPITYTLTKDGTVVATGLQGNEYTLSGIGPKLTTFRTCVKAINQKAQESPEMCATWTKS